MNKDASKFTVQNANGFVREHRAVIPFMEFGNFIEFENETVHLNGQTYRLKLFSRYTSLPADSDRKWKALAVAIDAKRLPFPGKPEGIIIEVRRLIFVCRTLSTPGADDTISWYVQKMEFYSESSSPEACFDGKSEITEVEYWHDLGQFFPDPSQFQKKFVETLLERVTKSIKNSRRSLSKKESLKRLLERTPPHVV